MGPAFVASIAYMDPGNFATNIQGGAGFGYRLLWVVVLANLMAMLFQGLSAKLGIVTGKNLAELSREHAPKAVALGMWVVSEFGAMATDLAEFLGAIVGLYLLFHIPMLAGAIITGIVTYAILALHRYGFRTMETLIGSLVGIIAICYVVETLLAKPNWGQVLYHSVVPWLGGSSSILLAVGIVGATVMPHAIYLHSALTQDRIVPRSAQARRADRAFCLHGRHHRSDDRGARQSRDDVHGGGRLSRDRTRQRGRHRYRLPDADAAARKSWRPSSSSSR